MTELHRPHRPFPHNPWHHDTNFRVGQVLKVSPLQIEGSMLVCMFDGHSVALPVSEVQGGLESCREFASSGRTIHVVVTQVCSKQIHSSPQQRIVVSERKFQNLLALEETLSTDNHLNRPVHVQKVIGDKNNPTGFIVRFDDPELEGASAFLPAGKVYSGLSAGGKAMVRVEQCSVNEDGLRVRVAEVIPRALAFVRPKPAR